MSPTTVEPRFSHSARRRVFRVAGEELLKLGLAGDAVDADIDQRGAGLYHIGVT